VTWIVVWATVAHLLGDTVWAISALSALFKNGMTPTGRPTTAVEVIGDIIHAYAYSMLFLASAATVEFLFRILEELRRQRTRSPS
jgi:hypothetical protein